MGMGRDSMLDQYKAEHGTWEALARQIEAENIDPELKVRAVDATPKLSRHLGENWPGAALREGHVLTELFLNHAAWTRSYLCGLADAMDSVAGLPRWLGLRNRVRKADQAVGAIFELDLAARALRQGLHVVLEPKSRGNRRADLAISARDLGPETLYVEAKHIQNLLQRAYDAEKLADRVLPIYLFAANLSGGGRFLRAPRPEEIRDLEQKADEFWAERRRDRTRGELVIDELLEIWGADRGDHEARDYFMSRGYSGPDNFEGPPVVLDAFGRIRYAIQEESEQLPATAGGLIVLEAPAEPDLLQVSSEVVSQVVESVLQPYQHVNAVALIRRAPSPRAPAHEIRALGRGSVRIVSPRYLIYAEEVVLVRNPSRVYRAADGVIERLFGVPE